ncbi:MAG: ribonuclease HII [Bacteroidota bacterium]|nr:MAG: ribonuclease HII [Bacteroidota bacterium]
MLKAYFIAELLEAGCDEAGRGCLAGPVVAAAVVLPPDYYSPVLTDSKKLSEKKRIQLRAEIEKEAVDYAVAFVDHTEIDLLNIQKASIKAMHLALEKLKVQPGHILVDGNRFYSYRQIPHTCIVKGDSLYFSIAAASVLAKTSRDDFMVQLHQQFPEYGFAVHKGYPTKEHRRAILQYGITNYHRRSFKLLDAQTSLDF